MLEYCPEGPFVLLAERLKLQGERSLEQSPSIIRMLGVLLQHRRSLPDT